jgi:RNA polymerase sigma-70 factor (sigma-E family)
VQRSFEQFVESASAGLVRAARLLLANPADAEDLVQEVLIIMYRRWPYLRDLAAAQSYSHVTLVRLTKRHLRRARFRHDRPFSLETHDAAAGSDPRHDDELASALARLPRRQREAIVLRFFLDLSVEDAARIMRTSQGAIKSQVSKGLATLRTQLSRTPLDEPAPLPSTKGDRYDRRPDQHPDQRDGRSMGHTNLRSRRNR